MSRLIVIGPLPPPFHGVSISTDLVLRNEDLHANFDVEHLDTSDPRTVTNVGRWDVRNVVSALDALRRLGLLLRGRSGLVYLPISQGVPGLARDTLMIRLAAAMGWKVAVHLRGSELGGVYRQQPTPLRSWLKRSLDDIAGIAALGESLCDLLDGIVPPGKVAVVPNGTTDPGPPQGARNGRGVFLGNFYARKGVREAAEAALLVTQRRETARFVFAGDCPDPNLALELERISRRSSGRIEIRPPVKGAEKEKLLLSSGFMIFPPARPEGHPRVVLEGLAAGLPVITTDRGAIRDTVVDGESGYVLPAPVPKELADRIIRLHDDDALRERMSAAARHRFDERFRQELADRRLATWLSEIAAG